MSVCSLCQSFAEDKYRIVYEDESVFVIVNNSPLKDGHVIVLPVRHAENLSDLTPEEAKAFLTITDRCMQAAEKLGGAASVAVVNGWPHRSEAHLHLHVIPSKQNVRGLLVASEGVERRVFAETETLAAMAQAFFKTLHEIG